MLSLNLGKSSFGKSSFITSLEISESQKSVYKGFFKKVESKESKLSKDLMDFEMNEMKELIKEIKIKSIATARVYSTAYRKYMEYNDKEAVVSSKDFMAHCKKDADVYFLENEIKELTAVGGILTNPSDRALIIGLFSGLTLDEISNLKISDIDFEQNIVYTYTGRRIEVSEYAIQKFIDSNKESIYLKSNGTMENAISKTTPILGSKKSEYVIKANKTTLSKEDLPMTEKSLYSRLVKMKTYRSVVDYGIDSEKFKPMNIIASGYINYLLKNGDNDYTRTNAMFIFGEHKRVTNKIVNEIGSKTKGLQEIKDIFEKEQDEFFLKENKKKLVLN